MAALALQIALGITTVLYGAPWQMAIVHQVLAVVLWVLILRARFLQRLSHRAIRERRLTMTAYDDLMAYQRDTQALAQVAGRLGWDQETMMPRGAAAQRGEEMAAMESVLHARRTDPRWATGWTRSTRARWMRWAGADAPYPP